MITKEAINEVGIALPQNALLRQTLLKYLRIDSMNQLCEEYKGLMGSDFIEEVFNHLNINIEVSNADLANIPKTGGFIVISNHPFGFLDGLVLIHLFARRNPDFKVLANLFLKQFAQIESFFIELNTFKKNDATNFVGLRQAHQHLQNGFPLGIFPAGEVSTVQNLKKGLVEKEWDLAMVKFIAKAKVPVIPVYFSGSNSWVFHALGRIHPMLRTLSIPSEFFKKENNTVNVRIGSAVSVNQLMTFDKYAEMGQYLRASVFALEGSIKKHKPKSAFPIASQIQPLVQPVSKELLRNEIELIKSEGGLIIEKAEYQVFIASAHKMPYILREIGRLREHTFRNVGEGTNKSIDVDKYDVFYKHLFVWDNQHKTIVGAYRMGQGDDLIYRSGIRGFYTSTLFQYNPDFIQILGRSLELGRSFVRVEYQQKPLPLYLLWQGIVKFLDLNKQYRYVLGPVSISNEFSRFSKDLMITHIKQSCFDYELAKMVNPRKAYKIKSSAQELNAVLKQSANDLKQIDRFISNIEPTQMKIPVLLKKYLRQNAKIIGFNVDPKFNNSLDGLMILDVNNLPNDTMEFLNHR